MKVFVSTINRLWADGKAHDKNEIVRNLNDKDAERLLKAGYIKEVEESEAKKPITQKEEPKKKEDKPAEAMTTKNTMLTPEKVSKKSKKK